MKKHHRPMPSKEKMQAALSWWRSLPPAKKKYLKEHSKLTDNVSITRFWMREHDMPGSKQWH